MDLPEFKPVMAALDKAFLARDTELIRYLEDAETELNTFLAKQLSP